MAKTPITERDLRMPEFRDCTLEELERREDGSIARRDRWEQGIRQLAGIMGFDPRKQFEVADVVAAVKAMKTAVEPQPASALPVASMASQRQPYTAERMLEQLQIWDDNQRAIAVASGDLWDSLPLPAAWAACRRSAKGAGIKIRPLMPGDKPNGEQEYAELYDFLYAENLRDGLLS